MEQAAAVLADSLKAILGDELIAVYLYGSSVMNDYQPGWSDIDILCLTENPAAGDRASALLGLRQRLLEREPENPYYGSFEGAVVSLRELRAHSCSSAVCWGTSGQRLTDQFDLDVFSRYVLLRYGQLVYGREIRESLPAPSYAELREGVAGHLRTIRSYAVKTSGSLYSCGWLLDIARGIYTLRTGEVAAKTRAGEWALEQDLCPVRGELLRTLEIRRQPMKYRGCGRTASWLSSLGPAVQRFADVLEAEIGRTGAAGGEAARPFG